MYPSLRQNNDKRGLTLVETVIVVTLFSIVMAIISTFISSFYRHNGYTLAQSYQVSEAREGIELMIRDIREMTYADDGTFPLEEMQPYRISFYSDIDRDNSVEYVEYVLSTTTTTFRKHIYNATGTPITYGTTPDTSVTISEYVQNDLQNIPVFVYYDENGLPATATTTVTDIRYVQVNLIVNIDPVRDPGEYMLRSSASLRNLKINDS